MPRPDSSVTASAVEKPGMNNSWAAAASLSVDVAVHALQYYSRYFDAPYPVSKLDMVEVPGFAHVGMENLGLITYDERYLLVDPRTTAAAAQEAVYVICHEISHQWFGNVVTMEWWGDLWLNEGFATWAGWLAVDALYPQWRVWEQFVNHDVNVALVADAAADVRSVQQPDVIGLAGVEQVRGLARRRGDGRGWDCAVLCCCR